MRSAQRLEVRVRVAPAQLGHAEFEPRRARRRRRCRPRSAARRPGTACAPSVVASAAMPAFTLSSWRAIHAGSWRAASRLRSRNIGDARVGDAVAQRLVAARASALAPPAGISAAAGNRVEVLADHRRVVDRLAVVHHQRGHLVERVVARHRGRRRSTRSPRRTRRRASSPRGSRGPCARRGGLRSDEFHGVASGRGWKAAEYSSEVIKFPLSRCPRPSPPSRPSTGATPPRPGRCRSTSASSR